MFKQTFFQLLAKLVTSLSTFFILSIIASKYSQEGLGVFTLSFSYLGLFMIVSDFGFNGHLLKQMQNNSGEEIFRKLLGVRILWALVLVVLSIILLPFFAFTGEQFLIVSIAGSLSIVGIAIFTTTNLIFQKNLRYDLSAIATILGTIVYLLLVLFFSQKAYPLVYISIAAMLGWIGICFFSILFAKLLIKNILPIFDLKFARSLFKETWPIATTLLLNLVYFRVDAFLIAYFRNLSEVGIYNLAYQFFQAALVLPIFIMNGYYPFLLKSYSGLKAAIVVLISVSVIGTLLTFIFSPILITTLAGVSFEGSVVSLKILSLGFPAFFLSALFMWILVAEGRYKLLLKFYTSALILNLILNILYVPLYSFVAASIITVLCEYWVLLLQLISLRKILIK